MKYGEIKNGWVLINNKKLYELNNFLRGANYKQAD